jgi:negative regulator of sigma E activity
MSHITKEEYLSAFLDGESGSFEQQRLSDQLGTDDLMQDKLSSFALIGESMRNQEQLSVASSSFLAGIQDAIADDECVVTADLDESPAPVPETIDKKRIFPRQTVGYAVAASFAAIAAVSLQNYLKPAPVEEMMAKAAPVIEQSTTADVAVMAAAITSAPKPAAQRVNYVTPDAETRGLMNQYVAHHFQYASTSTLMPRVRAVSYSTDF